jgi:hypothetical protein
VLESAIPLSSDGRIPDVLMGACDWSILNCVPKRHHSGADYISLMDQ